MDNMTPEYEVKLLLKPTMVLGPDNKLNDAVLTAFNMRSTVKKLDVQYLDTSDKRIFLAHWSPRIRKIEDEEGFELTYKKRYPIKCEGIDGITAALGIANKNGFHAGETEYEAQVEWGYEKRTLSISRKEAAAETETSGEDLPGEGDSRDMLLRAAPDKFNNAESDNWGTDALRASRIFGPVFVKRSTGKWEEKKVFIEVWPIRNDTNTGMEYLVEASFKTKRHEEATELRQKFVTYLEGKHWLFPKDVPKTDLIMKRY